VWLAPIRADLFWADFGVCRAKEGPSLLLPVRRRGGGRGQPQNKTVHGPDRRPDGGAAKPGSRGKARPPDSLGFLSFFFFSGSGTRGRTYSGGLRPGVDPAPPWSDFIGSRPPPHLVGRVRTSGNSKGSAGRTSTEGPGFESGKASMRPPLTPRCNGGRGRNGQHDGSGNDSES